MAERQRAGEDVENQAGARRGGSARLGKYQLVARIGSGGMADVFLAVARGPMGFNKLAVVKRLREAALSEGPAFIDMFIDEARLAARLAHPNVVHTYEVGVEDGVYFIAMEYLEGQSLNRVSRAARTADAFTHAAWARIIAEALGGLHYAHQLADYDGTPLGIVHRDISPHNIFITYAGEVKIVDFGIAKAALNNTHTETGILKGKVRYMALEQAYGEVDRRSDVFSMGVVLWEMVSGQDLFKGDAVQVIHNKLTQAVPRLSEVVPTVDPTLDAIVAKALAKEASDRYQTAEEMREALEAYVRSTGELIRDADIARAMVTMFHDHKEKVAKRVEAFMALGTSPSFTADTSTAPLLSLPTLPGSGTPSHGKVPDFSPAVSEASSPKSEVVSTPRHGRRRIQIVLGVLLAVLALVVLAVRSRTAEKTAVAPAPVPVAKQDKVTLSLASQPPGALVDWNGQPVGRTPLKFDLPNGRQRLVISKDGFNSETLVVDLEEGTTELSREVTLREREATANANANAKAPVAAPPPPPPPAPALGPFRHAPVAPRLPVAPSSAPAASPAASPSAVPVPSTPSKVKVLEEDNKTKLL